MERKSYKKQLHVEMSSDKPSADALLITDRDRCFAPVGKPGICGVLDNEDSVSWLERNKKPNSLNSCFNLSFCFVIP